MIKDIILLIGMPGCGKSTIGKLLAKKIDYNFCDMDKYIEEREGKTIKEIYLQGEEIFRDIESKACKELSNREKIVIATGGGVVKRKENIDAFKNKATIIYIDRPLENILTDINIKDRALFKEGSKKLYKLYEERYNLYNNYSDYKVSNEKSIEDLLESIVSIIK